MYLDSIGRNGSMSKISWVSPKLVRYPKRVLKPQENNVSHFWKSTTRERIREHNWMLSTKYSWWIYGLARVFFSRALVLRACFARRRCACYYEVFKYDRAWSPRPYLITSIYSENNSLIKILSDQDISRLKNTPRAPLEQTVSYG